MFEQNKGSINDRRKNDRTTGNFLSKDNPFFHKILIGEIATMKCQCQKSILSVIIFLFALLYLIPADLAAEEKKFSSSDSIMIDIKDIRIRDPFIVTDSKTSTYYMYAQTGNRAGSDFQGVEVYTSKDLKKWTAPVPVLKLPAELGAIMVWAPEVHFYKDAWYLFVTLTFDRKVSSPAPFAKNWPPMYKRGTWVFRAESPKGPFLPLADDSITPPDWMALDGTLWVENNKPFMIFCHEWVQIIDGTVQIMALSDDLSKAVGKPQLLLKASSAPGANKAPKSGKVTDGPFIYQSQKDGSLNMIWSTFINKTGYCVLVTQSQNGLKGPWSPSKPLFTKHGGHGMIFKSLDGRLLLALHQPNHDKLERLMVIELVDTDNGLQVKEQ